MEFFQIHIGDELSDLRKYCIETVKNIAYKTNNKYKMIIAEPQEGLINYIQSDILRYKYAQENENAFYVDTDVELYSLPIFEKGKPYVARYKSHRIDSFLFFVNGCPQFFKKVLDDALKNRSDMRRNWMSRTLEKYMNDVAIIEQQYFKHHRLKGSP